MKGVVCQKLEKLGMYQNCGLAEILVSVSTQANSGTSTVQAFLMLSLLMRLKFAVYLAKEVIIESGSTHQPPQVRHQAGSTPFFIEKLEAQFCLKFENKLRTVSDFT